MSWDDTVQSVRGYEEYVLSARKHWCPTEVQVRTSAVFYFCGVGWDLASSKAKVMGLVYYRSVRATSQDEKLGRHPVQQPITLIALKIIFRQINTNPVCLEPEGDWRKRGSLGNRVSENTKCVTSYFHQVNTKSLKSKSIWQNACQPRAVVCLT